jgi:hypothetical protein
MKIAKLIAPCILVMTLACQSIPPVVADSQLAGTDASQQAKLRNLADVVISKSHEKTQQREVIASIEIDLSAAKTLPEEARRKRDTEETQRKLERENERAAIIAAQLRAAISELEYEKAKLAYKGTDGAKRLEDYQKTYEKSKTESEEKAREFAGMRK